MNKRIPIIIGLLLMILSIWMQITSVESIHLLITRLDNLAYDMQLRAQVYTHKPLVNPDVVIVDIDDKSLHAEGRWPWPRNLLGDLLDRLQEEGVVVVAFDMMFPENENNIVDELSAEIQKRNLSNPGVQAVLDQIKPDLDNDSKFAAGLTNKDEVLGITLLYRDSTTGQLPPPIYVLSKRETELGFYAAKGYIASIPQISTAAKNGGFINVYADPDGIIRRVPILMRYKDNLYPSLAFKAVNLYLLNKIELITGEYRNTYELEGVKLGDYTIPTDSRAQVLVPFVGKSYTFPYYSATDVLHKKIAPNVLAGKIVFVGTSATGLGDLQATSIQGVFPGVEIQASIAQGIINKHFSYTPAWAIGAEISVTVIIGIILAFLLPFLGPRATTLLAVIIPIVLIFGNNWVWMKTGLIIFILVPIILVVVLALFNTIFGYVFETRKRERIKEMFGQYVPEDHIDEMLQAKSNYALMGDDREMTVLFADIRNFTAISEPMTASELKDMLNEFFTPMTEIIFKHKGTIDKYIGDLIMAFWGAPLRDKRHAQHAISSALSMQKAVDNINPVFAERGWAKIEIGIGLNTGIMSVGDMGSKFRRNYTVLGDAVNLASRVEGLTKYYGVKIMVAENTIKNQTLFVFRQLDRVRVKGKKLGVAIYEVVTKKFNAPEALLNEMKMSDAALTMYFNQEWDESYKTFEALHHQQPQVKLYKLYLERINEFKTNPPPTDWDGVYAHASK
jgi:adenylate cyclase